MSMDVWQVSNYLSTRRRPRAARACIYYTGTDSFPRRADIYMARADGDFQLTSWRLLELWRRGRSAESPPAAHAPSSAIRARRPPPRTPSESRLPFRHANHTCSPQHASETGAPPKWGARGGASSGRGRGNGCVIRFRGRRRVCMVDPGAGCRRRRRRCRCGRDETNSSPPVWLFDGAHVHTLYARTGRRSSQRQWEGGGSVHNAAALRLSNPR